MAKEINSFAEVGETLNKIVQKVKTRASRLLAEKVCEEAKKNYETIIDRFYSHYTPTRYKRTFSTYRGISVWHYSGNADVIRRIMGNSIISKNGGKTHEVHITVGGANIPGEPYHKFYNKDRDRTSENAMIKAEDVGAAANKELIFTNTFAKGLHGTCSDTESMNPTPKTLMDNWWKTFVKSNEIELCGKEAVNQAFKEVLGR